MKKLIDQLHLEYIKRVLHYLLYFTIEQSNTQIHQMRTLEYFSELYGEWEGKLDMQLFRAAYPRYPDISQIHVSTQERDYTMDLRAVMNRTPSPVLHSTPLPQVALTLKNMKSYAQGNCASVRSSLVYLFTKKNIFR